MAEDGILRFFRAVSWESFLHEAFAIGLTILNHERQFEPYERWSYWAMYQIVQLVRRMPEHIDRNFNWPKDLFGARMDALPIVNKTSCRRTCFPPEKGSWPHL